MRNARMTIFLVVFCMVVFSKVASAETIQGINIDFVSIGNAGNSADTTGFGAVGYNYRIGKYEVTNAQWYAFTDRAGFLTGNPYDAYDQPTYFYFSQQPTNMVSWYEVAQFCNYLTSGNKSLGAYQLGIDGSITVNRAWAISNYGTAYVIPTEDEWYKAAYFNPNGSSYSLYANGTYTAPLTSQCCYGQDHYVSQPWMVGGSKQEQNGTFDMMGNVWEWNETLFGTSYVIRGGSYSTSDLYISSYRSYTSGMPSYELRDIGFRVASVPEPCSLVLLSLGGLALLRKKN